MQLQMTVCVRAWNCVLSSCASKGASVRVRPSLPWAIVGERKKLSPDFFLQPTGQQQFACPRPGSNYVEHIGLAAADLVYTYVLNPFKGKAAAPTPEKWANGGYESGLINFLKRVCCLRSTNL